MQSFEDDINTLQSRMQGGNPAFAQVAEVRQFKDVINPVMKDIELRLKTLETTSGDQASDDNLQMMKQRFHPVMQDIERRLVALENRPVETAISNVSFAEENPSTMTTLIERVPVLDRRWIIWNHRSQHYSHRSLLPL